MRPIPSAAVDFVSQWEGCRLAAYRDVAGVLTIGYGHTGADVIEGQRITSAQARGLLAQDLTIAEARLRQRIGQVADELSESRFTALLSFVFNLGAHPNWTIWKLLRAGRFDEIPAQLARFVNAGGRPVKGLVRRRAAEIELWHAETSAPVLPSFTTRVMATEPTPSDTKPLSRSKSFMASAATAIAAASAGIGQVSQAVSPFAAQSQLVGRMVSALAIMAAGLALAAVFFVWLKKRNA